MAPTFGKGALGWGRTDTWDAGGVAAGVTGTQ